MPSRIRLLALLAALMLVWGSMPATHAAGTAHEQPVIGVRLEHPAAANLLDDQQVGDTFGFTVLDAALGSDHTPLLLRVAQIQGTTTPEQKARELRAQFPKLPLQQCSVSFARLQGIAVLGVPGEYHATTYLYVRANNRVYEIIYGGATLDARAMSLLNGLRFTTPRATVASLHLPSANDTVRVALPAAIQQQNAQASARRTAAIARAQSAGGASQANTQASALDAQATSTQVLGGAVTPAYATFTGLGCASWPTWKSTLQVPWDDNAWGSGWSKAGPSWYGEGGHVNCNTATLLNDYHAVDFPLYEWNSVYAPAAGRVIYAGWASGGWASAGRVVIIDLGDGYWSSAFHLRSINVSVGQYVTLDTTIGYAGGSSYGRDNYYGVHLHQGLYLNAQLYASQGGVYGGQSVEPLHIRRTYDGYIYPSIGAYAWMRY